MPKIIQYIAQQPVAGPLRIPRAAPAAFGGGVARGITEFGKKLEEKEERDADFWVEKKMSEARAEWTNRLQTASQGAEPGAKDFTEQFMKTFDDDIRALSDAAPTNRSGQKLGARIANLRSSINQKAFLFESQSAGAFRKEQVKQSITDAVNTVRADPAQRMEILVENANVIDALQIPKGNKDTIKREASEAIHSAAMNANLDSIRTLDDALHWQNELKVKDLWKNEMSTSQFDQALRRSRQMVNHHRSNEQRIVIDGLKDAIPEMEAGIAIEQGPEWVARIETAIDDPKRKKEMIDRVTRAAETGFMVNKTKDASPNELVSEFDKINAKVQTKGDFRADVREQQLFLKALARRENALKNDAAGYVLKTNENLNTQFQEALVEVNKLNNGEDNQAAEELHNYAVSMQAEQIRLRGPLTSIDILPKTYMASISADLSDVERTPEGAQKSFERLRREADLWGRHWPEVLGQMQRNKIVTGAESVAAGLTDPHKRIVGQTLMRASYIGDKELKKQIDRPGLMADVNTAVQDKTAEFRATLVPQVGGDAHYRNYADATKTLAMFYISRGEDNAAAAVERAGDELFATEWTFTDTYRIPVDIEPASTQNGADEIQRTIDRNDIIIPGVPPGVRTEDQKNMALSVLRKQAVWITNRDETGLQLAWPEANGEFTGALITTKTGEVLPLEYTWAELEDAAGDQDDDDEAGELE